MWLIILKICALLAFAMVFVVSGLLKYRGR
jgi:hypothetical protein